MIEIENKIKDLWQWFVANEDMIRSCIENESSENQDYIIENLDNLVLNFGMFTWEVDKGINKPLSFTISPNGDHELLKISKKIIREAPQLDAWEINASKPAKIWERQFAVYDEVMNAHDIDATDWNYVTSQLENNKLDIIIEACNIGHLDNDTSLTAANLVVINEIGEEAKIRVVNKISIVDQLEPDYESRKMNIENLKKQITEIS